MIWEIGSWALGDLFDMDGPLTISWFACPSSFRVSYLVFKSTCEGEVGREGLSLLPKAEIWFHSLLSLRSPPSAWWQEGRGFFISYAVPGWLICLKGWQRTIPPVHLSLWFPSTPPPRQPTFSQSSAPRLSSSSTQAHLPGVFISVSRHWQKARAHPAVWVLVSCMLPEDLCLGCHWFLCLERPQRTQWLLSARCLLWWEPLEGADTASSWHTAHWLISCCYLILVTDLLRAAFLETHYIP